MGNGVLMMNDGWSMKWSQIKAGMRPMIMALVVGGVAVPLLPTAHAMPDSSSAQSSSMQSESVTQTEQAAQKGIAGAQHDLALMYETGDGVPQDLTKARSWYEKAAQQGLADSQYNLALLYHEGRGGERDYVKARSWYEKAAAQGMAHAAYNLGIFYVSGRGVAPSKQMALMWFKKACDGGDNKGCAAYAVLNIGH